MKPVIPGHVYDLASLDGEHQQRLTFVMREGVNYPGNVGHHPGTTSQDVLRVLIDRARYVYQQIPCIETEAAIRMMQSALLYIEIRAKRVKGKTLPLVTSAFIEKLPTCATCGHILCEEKHA